MLSGHIVFSPYRGWRIYILKVVGVVQEKDILILWIYVAEVLQNISKITANPGIPGSCLKWLYVYSDAHNVSEK